MVQTGVAGFDDLFLHTVTPTITYHNLTESPAITETWPTFDATAQRVVYYGVGENSTDLYIQSLPDGAALALTVRAGKSGLHTQYEIVSVFAPVFSPDGSWLAFPAQAKESGAVEVYVARDSGQFVSRVTDLGYQVRDCIWIDDRTLTILAQRPDGTYQKWVARSISQGEFQLESVP